MKTIESRTITLETCKSEKGTGLDNPKFFYWDGKGDAYEVPVVDYRKVLAQTHNGTWCGQYLGLTEEGRLLWGDRVFGPYPCNESEERATLGTVYMLMRLNPEIAEKVLNYKFRSNPYFCYYTWGGNLELLNRVNKRKSGMWLGDYLICNKLKNYPGRAFTPRVKGMTVREVLNNMDDIVFTARVINKREGELIHDYRQIERDYHILTQADVVDENKNIQDYSGLQEQWVYNTVNPEFQSAADLFWMFSPLDYTTEKAVGYALKECGGCIPYTDEFEATVERIGLLETIKLYKWDVAFAQTYRCSLKYFLWDYLKRCNF